MQSEGYCGTCRYLIELSEEGRLIRHGERTTYLNDSSTGPCAGTAAFPVAIGDEDPTAAFSSEWRTGRCPVCKQEDVVAREVSGRAYMLWHKAPQQSQDLPGTVCPGTWDPIEYV